MKATTDSLAKVHFDVENQPGVSNLMTIYSVFSGKSFDEIEKLYDGKGYGDFKKDLVEITIDGIRPIRERFNEIRNSQELLTALDDGRDKASAIAEKTLKRVFDTFGLGRK